MTTILTVDDLEVRYGAALAIESVSLTLDAGAVLALVGPNGAGKSSLVRAISGLVPATRGRIEFDGEDITGRRPDEIRRRGMVHLPEGRGVFTTLSVKENLRMAVQTLRRKERLAALDRAYEVFPVLGQRRGQLAGTLSGGEQQMLSLARALVVTPKVLLADELSLGLAPQMVDVVFENLGRIRDAGVALIVTEQYVHRILDVADTAVVMNRGALAWSGPAAEAKSRVADGFLADIS